MNSLSKNLIWRLTSRYFEFNIALSPEQIRSVYEGQTRYFLVKSDAGLKLQVPAVNFRSFVTTDGIHGRFSVTIDASNKLVFGLSFGYPDPAAPANACATDRADLADTVSFHS